MGEKNNFPLKGVRKIVAFLFEATECVRKSASPATPRSHCVRPLRHVPGLKTTQEMCIKFCSLFNRYFREELKQRIWGKPHPCPGKVP